jgi:hypothetical protein
VLLSVVKEEEPAKPVPEDMSGVKYPAFPSHATQAVTPKEKGPTGAPERSHKKTDQTASSAITAVAVFEIGMW